MSRYYLRHIGTRTFLRRDGADVAVFESDQREIARLITKALNAQPLLLAAAAEGKKWIHSEVCGMKCNPACIAIGNVLAQVAS